MTWWLAGTLAALLFQQLPDPAPLKSGIHELAVDLPGGGTMLYAVSIPRGYDPARPAPLVLVLHSGGQRMRYYGSAFMKLLAQPGLDGLRPIMIAPDCPGRDWSDPVAEEAVMALMNSALQRYSIDRRRVLVTGFSMGGRGTWVMASRHPDLFTGAIPMAGAPGNLPIETLGTMPTYVIHSRDDEVSPFAPAERNAKQLAAMGRPVRFEALMELTHFEMYKYVDALRQGARWMAEQWRKAN